MIYRVQEIALFYWKFPAILNLSKPNSTRQVHGGKNWMHYLTHACYLMRVADAQGFNSTVLMTHFLRVELHFGARTLA